MTWDGKQGLSFFRILEKFRLQFVQDISRNSNGQSRCFNTDHH